MTEVKIQTVSELLGIGMTCLDDEKGFKMTQGGLNNKVL